MNGGAVINHFMKLSEASGSENRKRFVQNQNISTRIARFLDFILPLHFTRTVFINGASHFPTENLGFHSYFPTSRRKEPKQLWKRVLWRRNVNKIVFKRTRVWFFEKKQNELVPTLFFYFCPEFQLSSAFAFAANSTVSINYRAATLAYHFLTIFIKV